LPEGETLGARCTRHDGCGARCQTLLKHCGCFHKICDPLTMFGYSSVIVICQPGATGLVLVLRMGTKV
jgi:hypothetical protein